MVWVSPIETEGRAFLPERRHDAPAVHVPEPGGEHGHIPLVGDERHRLDGRARVADATPSGRAVRPRRA